MAKKKKKGKSDLGALLEGSKPKKSSAKAGADTSAKRAKRRKVITKKRSKGAAFNLRRTDLGGAVTTTGTKTPGGRRSKGSSNPENYALRPQTKAERKEGGSK
jgi:hypothetical protein